MANRRGVLGIYSIGNIKVRVRLLGNWRGAAVYASAPPEISVGCRNEDWPFTVGLLTHEAMEFALERLGARYEPSPDYARATDGYVFHFDHRALGEACAEVGIFLAEVLPDFSTAYKRAKAAKK